MKKLWKEIKSEVSFEKDMYVDEYSADPEGYCLVYITNGKYEGFQVVGRIIFGEKFTELVIDDDAIVYDPRTKE